MVGLGSTAVLAGQSRLNILFGQSESLEASQVLKDQSYESGLKLLWDDTERTGFEHHATFVKYKDGTTAWIRMHARVRTAGSVQGNPQWEGISKDNIEFAIYVHTHPLFSKTFAGRKDGETRGLSSPPSDWDINMGGHIHGSRMALTEKNAKYLFGAVRVKAGVYYYSHHNEAELRNILSTHKNLDFSYTRTREKVTQLRAGVADDVYESIKRADVRTLLRAAEATLNPGSPDHEETLRHIHNVRSRLSAGEGPSLTLLQINLNSNLIYPRARDISRCRQAMEILEGKSNLYKQYENFLTAEVEYDSAFGRAHTKIYDAIIKFAHSSAVHNGDESEFLKTQQGRELFFELQGAYASMGAYVCFVANDKITQDLEQNSNPADRR